MKITFTGALQPNVSIRNRYHALIEPVNRPRHLHILDTRENDSYRNRMRIESLLPEVYAPISQFYEELTGSLNSLSERFVNKD